MAQNTFWIDILIGETKYTDDKVCLNQMKMQLQWYPPLKTFHLCGWNTLGSKMYIYPIYA